MLAECHAITGNEMSNIIRHATKTLKINHRQNACTVHVVPKIHSPPKVLEQ